MSPKPASESRQRGILPRVSSSRPWINFNIVQNFPSSGAPLILIFSNFREDPLNDSFPMRSDKGQYVSKHTSKAVEKLICMIEFLAKDYRN